jgi:hypothetical protein
MTFRLEDWMVEVGGRYVPVEAEKIESCFGYLLIEGKSPCIYCRENIRDRECGCESFRLYWPCKAEEHVDLEMGYRSLALYLSRVEMKGERIFVRFTDPGGKHELVLVLALDY